MKLRYPFSFLAGLALVFALNLFSQNSLPPPQRLEGPILIKRFSGPITLDGLSQEAAWKEIRPLQMVSHIPDFGNPPSEKTEVLLGFDDNYLYVAGRLYDREPLRIQSPSKKRDYSEGGSDWFGVVLDTFNDKENGLAFLTTPSGLRWDGAIFNDLQPRSAEDIPINISWNTFWDVETVINDQGWFVEMRIPFSSLRFQNMNGRVVMGLIAYRKIARKNEEITFPAIEPKWGFWSAWKPSQAQEIIMEGPKNRNLLYVAPYVLGGLEETYDLDEGGLTYVHSDKTIREAGLDLKYGLASNLILDVTLNTDFAQVEIDDFQVNLSRFSLFIPEKRTFFQERGSIFNFSLGGNSQLFYSRRIGLNEGKPVRIYGGARIVGRLGGWDLGFLDVQTASVEDLPSENFGVLRFRRRVFNVNSYFGGMITSRLGADGSYNIAYGLDASLRISSDNYILFNWAQTFKNGEANNAVSLDPAILRITWDRRTSKGLGFNLGYCRAGKDFDPGIGFMAQENFAGFGNRILYGWIPSERSFLQSYSVFADGYVILRNADNSINSLAFGPGWAFATKSGWMGEFAIKAYRESLNESLSFTGDNDSDKSDVPPGDYAFREITGQLKSPSGNLITALLNFDAGSFYDGWRVSIGLRPTWGISPTLSLSGIYQYNRAVFPARRHKFVAQIAQLRLDSSWSLTLSSSVFVQYNSAADALIANVRLRFNPREGEDFYLVFNQEVNTNRMRESLRRPFSSRAIMVKYSYIFNF
jgi:hypothetical protein